jgi:GntR family transcriptional repressor for pyruvate dehydrogenase complex
MVDDIRGAILSVIAAREGPVGQGTISLELRKQGRSPSVPTVGRRLQELEYEGFIKKVGVQGRILTERGVEAVNQMNAEAMLKVSGSALLKTLTRGDKQHLLDLLFVRRRLEGAAAALAAQRAAPQAVARLEQLLERQRASIGRGELGVQEDVMYHLEIARASGNSVLASLVALLRQHHGYNIAITSIRAEVGSRLVVDHGAILDAIKRKNPVAARRAMERHLRTLADDLNRYWTESALTAGASDDVAGELRIS